jgi:hypothetical protein
MTLIAAPEAPRHPATRDAHRVLASAHSTCVALYEAYVTSARPVAPTDHEQDLLRAMVLFASAGLDSAVKQLVADALPMLIVSDCEARARFRVYVERQLKGTGSARLLADALVAGSGREQMISSLVAKLQACSLQSVEELARAAAFFAVPAVDVMRDVDALRAAFRVRNEIAHELDVDFSRAASIRRQRRLDELERHANAILGAANNMLTCVGERLQRAEAQPAGSRLSGR